MTIKELNKLYEIDFPHVNIVTGSGSENADIMLIGEAPGRDEVAEGKPFVGKAGKNLSEFLEILDLKREDIFISNTVKFRPAKKSEYGNIANRTPTDEEVQLFLPYLLKEIEIINPLIVVTLGNTPLRALLGKAVTVGAVHGRRLSLAGRMLFPLFHPASLIYNPGLKDSYYGDLQKLKVLLKESRLSPAES